jgi:CBS domain-containing protein
MGPFEPHAARTASEAMVVPTYLHDASTTVAKLREFFRDDHVQCALITNGFRLLAVVTRSDLTDAGDSDPARRFGTLTGRVARPDDILEPLRLAMLGRGMRRMAVIGARGRLLGLLCLKRSGVGFCTAADIQARADERAATDVEPLTRADLPVNRTLPLPSGCATCT